MTEVSREMAVRRQVWVGWPWLIRVYAISGEADGFVGYIVTLGRHLQVTYARIFVNSLNRDLETGARKWKVTETLHIELKTNLENTQHG